MLPRDDAPQRASKRCPRNPPTSPLFTALGHSRTLPHALNDGTRPRPRHDRRPRSRRRPADDRHRRPDAAASRVRRRPARPAAEERAATPVRGRCLTCSVRAPVPVKARVPALDAEPAEAPAREPDAAQAPAHAPHRSSRRASPTDAHRAAPRRAPAAATRGRLARGARARAGSRPGRPSVPDDASSDRGRDTTAGCGNSDPSTRRSRSP